MYMIDKVVRMRMSDRHRVAPGRFGIDHSELLNFELHKTNKERDDHMNQLVYKYVPPTEYDLIGQSASASTLGDENSQGNYQIPEAKMSAILFNKLNPKKAEMKNSSADSCSDEDDSLNE